MYRLILTLLFLAVFARTTEAQQLTVDSEMDKIVSSQVGAPIAESVPLQGDLIRAQFAERMRQKMAYRSKYQTALNDTVLEGDFEQFTPQNTGSNGLSEPFVRFVHEATDGSLYFSTRGVDMWDGENWENLSPLNSNLPNVTVFEILEDHEGNIWFATFSGLARLDAQTDEIEVFIPDNSDIRSPLVYTLYQASDSLIYAGHRWDVNFEGGITVFNSDGEVERTLNYEDGFYGDSIEDFVEDADSNLYVATGPDNVSGEFGGINVWNLNTATVDTFYNKDNSDLPFNEVASLEVDEEGNLWAGFYMNPNIGHDEGGLVKFDGNTWFHHLPGNVVRDLQLDSNGILWIASNNGVFNSDGDSFSEIFDEDDSSFTNAVSTTELSDGRIAISILQTPSGGGGVSFLNTENDSWEVLSSNDDGGVNSPVKFGADYDSRGNLWSTGFHGLQKFDGHTWETLTEEDGLTDIYGWDLIVDQNDNVWVNGADNGITRIDADGTIEAITEYGEFVESNWEAKNGDLWFGSWYDNNDRNADGIMEANGMLHFDGENFTVYDSTDGLPAEAPILSIAEDQEGRILAASYDGLYRLEDGTFSKWEFDGYEEGVVRKLHLDSEDRLWIYSNRLSMFDGENWEHFDAEEYGYAEDIEHDMDGRVWFSQDDGAYIYDDGIFMRVNAESGFPTGSIYIYDLAPSRSHEGEMAFAAHNLGMIMMDRVLTSSEPAATNVPQGFKLNQNYPNPFNPTTKISYALPQNSHVRVSVYNAIGQQVAVLLNEVKSAGIHEVTFNANQLNSGMYIYRIEADNFSQTRKMMLIK